MRQYPITRINPSSAFPTSIEVTGNVTAFALGKYYQNEAGATLPFYTSPTPPAGYTLVVATTFEIRGNPKYNGHYTVYTPTSANDRPSSSFASGRSTINVNEIVTPVTGTDPPGSDTTGYVVNFSTYLISVVPDKTLVIPPLSQNDTDYSLSFIGRGITGWGEPFGQNFMDLMQNFAGNSAPSKPVTGQLHYSTADEQVRVWNGSKWGVANLKTFGQTYQHRQSTAATTWTITHNLNLPAPWIGLWQAFVDRSDAVETIVPASVEFVSANSVKLTFTNAESGYFIIRS